MSSVSGVLHELKDPQPESAVPLVEYIARLGIGGPKMRYARVLASRNAGIAGHLPAFRRDTGVDRLIDLPANKKLFLAAAIGIASLVLIGAVASQLVGNVKRQSDVTDRQHAMLIEIAAIAVNSGHMERLERDLTLSEATRNTAYIEATAHIGRSNAALPTAPLFPVLDPKRFLHHFKIAEDRRRLL